ncbi:hypothetical protein P4544_16210 [Halomonas sp. LY9]
MALLNVTQCAQGEVVQGAYATGAALNQAGVIAGGDMTLEAAVAKLIVLIGQGLTEPVLRKALSAPMRGEQSRCPHLADSAKEPVTHQNSGGNARCVGH